MKQEEPREYAPLERYTYVKHVVQNEHAVVLWTTDWGRGRGNRYVGMYWAEENITLDPRMPYGLQDFTPRAGSEPFTMSITRWSTFMCCKYAGVTISRGQTWKHVRITTIHPSNDTYRTDYELMPHHATCRIFCGQSPLTSASASSLELA